MNTSRAWAWLISDDNEYDEYKRRRVSAVEKCGKAGKKQRRWEGGRVLVIKVRYLLDDGGDEDGEHDSGRHIFPAREEETVWSAANHELDVVTEPEGGRHEEEKKV